MEREKATTGDVNALKTPPKPRQGVCICMPYTVWKTHVSVLSSSSEILCVCVCVGYGACSSLSWLQKLPGRCNLRVFTQTHTHNRRDRGAGSIFIISAACESEPWDRERPQCQVRWFFFCVLTSTEGSNNTTQIGADGRGGHREHWGGVQSVLRTHQHMQMDTDTQWGRTRRV